MREGRNNHVQQVRFALAMSNRRRQRRYRHFGRANGNFFDGHAKWYRLEQTLNPDNYLYGDKWYPAFNCPYNKCCK